MATKTRRLADFLANIDDDSRVTSAGLLDATITASDLAPNSVDTSELVNDAVTSDKIGTGAVVADGIGAGAVVAAGIGTGAVVEAKLGDGAVTAAKIGSDVIEVKPHIVPDILYPAVNGILIGQPAQTFVDSSASGHIVTAMHGAHHSNIQKKVGTSSIRVESKDTKSGFNSNGDGLEVGAIGSADWDFGTGAFTIEFWWMPTELHTINMNLLHTVITAAQDTDISIIAMPAGANNLIVNSGTAAKHAGGTGFTVNVWHHIAVTRDGSNNLKIYINGTVSGSTYTTSWDIDPADPIQIGRGASNGGKNTSGYFDEIRIVKGKQVYTGNFTPPTALTTTGGTYSSATNVVNPTSSETKLLIHSNIATSQFHSGAYGTTQSDGRKYYYTDIKGSKPIKDPRIGAHYGSQRHLMRSIQRLNKESGEHGKDIYSVDGREWMRINDNGQGLGNEYGGRGVMFEFNGHGAYLEVTGYFNEASLINYFQVTGDDFIWEVDGVAAGNKQSAVLMGHNIGKESNNVFRYVNSGAVYPLAISPAITTPGIHTLKIIAHADDFCLEGIELIAQDKTSTATKSNIQIPAQKVVSYGKKFALSAAGHHYNPFAFAGDGTTAVAIGNAGAHGKVATGWAGSTSGHFDSTLDVATSLGLDAWVTGGNYYRPVNGGRIVKWIDSTGTIKTSVNMMPPTATSKGATPVAILPTSHAWTTEYLPKFGSTTIDNSQSEVATTMHWYEFGNCAGNQGVNPTALADATRVNSTNDDVGYVMDDGLTSAHGEQLNLGGGGTSVYVNGDAKKMYFTFIGTGVTVHTSEGDDHGGTDDFKFYVDGVQVFRRTNTINRFFPHGPDTYAQNLPYGSHTFMWERVQANQKSYMFEEISFHQPKMPPIPNNATIIADYMLMADFVGQGSQITAGSVTSSAGQNIHHVSKGTRLVSCTRDFLSSGTGHHSVGVVYRKESTMGFNQAGLSTGTSSKWRLNAFCTNFVLLGFQTDARQELFVDEVSKDSVSIRNNDAGYGSFSYLQNASAATIGTHNVGMNCISSDGNWGALGIATPIHTSSHYQTFETPFQNELIGGDRNMEQTNLIVTADGKTWDEVRRDTSYQGDVVLQTTTDSEFAAGAVITFDEWRGSPQGDRGERYYFNKDWAFSQKKMHCLKAGWYTLHAQAIGINNTGGASCTFIHNGANVQQGHMSPNSYPHTTNQVSIYCQRNDWVEVQGIWHGNDHYNLFWITKGARA